MQTLANVVRIDNKWPSTESSVVTPGFVLSNFLTCVLLLLLTCVLMREVRAQPAGVPVCSGQQLAGWCASVPSSAIASCTDCPKTYLVRSYQGRTRCLDYTPELIGSPIIINDCQHSHPIVVEEISDGKHTVVLHAGTKVIGIKTNPVNATGENTTRQPRPSVTTEIPLELQDWNRVTSVGVNHFFSLDGDSIILASDRNLSARVQNSRGAVGSPITLGSCHWEELLATPRVASYELAMTVILTV